MIIRKSLALFPIVPKGTAIPDMSNIDLIEELKESASDNQFDKYEDYPDCDSMNEFEIAHVLSDYENDIRDLIEDILDTNNEDLTSSVYGWIDAIYTICLKDNGDWCLVFDDDMDERIEASLSNICSYYHSLVKEGRKIGKINESKVYINIVTIDIFVRNQPSFMIEI